MLAESDFLMLIKIRVERFMKCLIYRAGFCRSVLDKKEDPSFIWVVIVSIPDKLFSYSAHKGDNHGRVLRLLI